MELAVYLNDSRQFFSTIVLLPRGSHLSQLTRHAAVKAVWGLCGTAPTHHVTMAHTPVSRKASSPRRARRPPV
jgi:hypothetical protein